MLRRALAESMKRVKLMATEETVDRRIVVKLLITYFERDRSPEVLQLMFRMLGFTGPPQDFSCVILSILCPICL